MHPHQAGQAPTGIVITEVETSASGQTGAQSHTYHRTLMIEGNRQKMVTEGGRSVIIDLDQGTLETIDAASRSYTVMPYPIPGKMGGGPVSSDFEFVKTGGSERIAGYGCEMYSGKRKLGRSEVSVTTCISSEAPGAAEFTTFQNHLRAKLAAVSSPMMLARLPDGIPLAQSTVTRMIGITDLTPQAAANLRKPDAGRALVIKTEVTSVRAVKIADSEFEIPSGYTRR